MRPYLSLALSLAAYGFPAIRLIWEYGNYMPRRRINGRRYLKVSAYNIGELDTKSCQNRSADIRFALAHGFCPICLGPGQLDCNGGYRCKWNADHGPFTFAEDYSNKVWGYVDNPEEAFLAQEIVGDPEWAPITDNSDKKLCRADTISGIALDSARAPLRLGDYVSLQGCASDITERSLKVGNLFRGNKGTIEYFGPHDTFSAFVRFDRDCGKYAYWIGCCDLEKVD